MCFNFQNKKKRIFW